MVKELINKVTSLFNVRKINSLDKEARNLTSIYIFSLSSIAFIAILFQISKTTIYTNQIQSFDADNVIDRQIIDVEKTYNKIVATQIESDSKSIAKKISDVETHIAELSEEHKKIIEYSKDFHCSSLSCLEYLKSDYFENLQNKYNATSKSSNGVALEGLLSDIKGYQTFLLELNSTHDSLIKSWAERVIFMDNLFLFFMLLLLIIQAIWGFKPAVKKLNEALMVRSEFISRISHEIRNPMNSILGMAELLQSTNLNQEQRQYTENLERSGKTLLEMLNKLVDFSGAQNKNIELNPNEFNLKELIDKVIDIISIQAHNKGLEVFVDLDVNVPVHLKTDFVRLEQVLLNLLSNSIKFTEKGYILLKVDLVEHSVENALITFSVKDTGIGIAKENIKKIFNSFVQEDSSIKRRYGGSGLGLSICKEIVELMGSSISVESSKAEGWSRFYFTLDIQRARIDKIKQETQKPNDQHVVFHSIYENIEPINAYLNKALKDVKITRSIEDLVNYLSSHQDISHVVIDDSNGVVEMVESMKEIEGLTSENKIFALIKSDFPKESIETLRNNNFHNYLIKPFRTWHIEELAKKPVHEWMPKEKGLNPREGLKILVVDDSKDNLFLVKQLLLEITSRVDFAYDGQEAYEKINKKDYDFVFMDIQMPIMDGYTAIRHIRKKHKNLPVYAVTAHSTIVDEQKCLDAGFDGRLTKPISKTSVVTCVQKYFDLSQKEPPKEKDKDAERELIQKLLPAYFETRSEDIEQINDALNNEDFETIKKLGHRIKGSARSYGFPNIGELAHKLENSAEANDKERCTTLINEITKKIKHAEKLYNENDLN